MDHLNWLFRRSGGCKWLSHLSFFSLLFFQVSNSILDFNCLYFLFAADLWNNSPCLHIMNHLGKRCWIACLSCFDHFNSRTSHTNFSFFVESFPFTIREFHLASTLIRDFTHTQKSCTQRIFYSYFSKIRALWLIVVPNFVFLTDFVLSQSDPKIFQAFFWYRSKCHSVAIVYSSLQKHLCCRPPTHSYYCFLYIITISNNIFRFASFTVMVDNIDVVRDIGMPNKFDFNSFTFRALQV